MLSPSGVSRIVLRQQARAAQQGVDRAARRGNQRGERRVVRRRRRGQPEPGLQSGNVVRSLWGHLFVADRAQYAGKERGPEARPAAVSSAVADIGEDADAERRVDRQHFFGIDAEFAAARAQRPVDAVIIAPRQHLRDIGRFVGLVPNRQALAIARGSCRAAGRDGPGSECRNRRRR